MKVAMIYPVRTVHEPVGAVFVVWTILSLSVSVVPVPILNPVETCIPEETTTGDRKSVV